MITLSSPNATQEPAAPPLAMETARTPPARSLQARAVMLQNSLVILIAVCARLAVANNYYCQPLLTDIAADVHVGSSTDAVVILGLGFCGLALLIWTGETIYRRSAV